MLSGRRLDLLDPSPLDVEIEDIARGLARVARWNGQTSGDHAFSVAEHSVVVTDLFIQLNPKSTREQRLTALLHDAAEYVIVPPKMPAALKKKIKQCDLYCAWFEATQIAGFDPVEADKFFIAPPRDIKLTIDPLPVVEAETTFLKRFKALNG